MSSKRRLLRTTILSFLSKMNWVSPYALTFTFKQRVQNHKLDVITASQNIRNFVSRLNRKIFGNAHKRFLKALKFFPVIEYDQDKRFHVHAIIDKPDTINSELFFELIKKSWSKTKFGYDHIHIQPVTSNGWLLYMTKFKQKNDYGLSIDWMNVKN